MRRAAILILISTPGCLGAFWEADSFRHNRCDPPSDPKESMDLSIDSIRAMGYAIRDWERVQWITDFRHEVVRRGTLDRGHPLLEVAAAAHEETHVKQQVESNLGLRSSYHEWRWAMEVQSIRQAVIVLDALEFEKVEWYIDASVSWYEREEGWTEDEAEDARILIGRYEWCAMEQ